MCGVVRVRTRFFADEGHSVGSNDRAEASQTEGSGASWSEISCVGWSPTPSPSSFPKQCWRQLHRFQFAVSTKAGTEAETHALQALTSLDENATVVSIDGLGAFDLISLERHCLGVDGYGER